ncbi:popeye domain-containing protein 3 isoform X2 [Lepeophtheirus salmonis]|uniref:popeye domain-containing protein 3 isoform X2 n=1 Tax=Lepeophtheirus salmonis TaxID=72036 RepID=UPI001AE7D7CC|nr:popeye domain-containing protein 3-like isoform X2 [Lepeophtheirus salmonis]
MIEDFNDSFSSLYLQNTSIDTLDYLQNNESTTYLDDNGFIVIKNNDTSDFKTKNNVFFHLYQSFIFLSVILPWIATAFTLRSHNHTYSKDLYALCSLLFAHICGIIWALVPLILTEALVWMIIIFVICALRIFYTCYQLKPILFDPEIEEVYVKLFKPLRLSAKQFHNILKCMRGIVSLTPGEELVTEKVTRVDSLSLVLSGRLLVTQCGKPLHFVLPHQFIDSPEWFGVTTDEFFQISATALEDSRILIWHRDRLKLTLMKNQFLQTVFEHIIGRDVVKKLTQSQQEDDVNSVKFVIESDDIESEKPWYAAKTANNGGSRCSSNGTVINGVTSKLLINPMEESSTWSLARISEHDDETSV